MDTLELSNSWDADNAVSLDIEKRRARSRDWDKRRFILENKRRKLKGLELYADQKAWKSDNKTSDDDDTEAETVAEGDDNTEDVANDSDTAVSKEAPEVALTNSKDISVVDAADAKTEEDEEEEEDIAETDPMLQEAGHILADQIRLLAKPTSKQMMVRSQKVDK